MRRLGLAFAAVAVASGAWAASADASVSFSTKYALGNYRNADGSTSYNLCSINVTANTTPASGYDNTATTTTTT